MLQQATKTRKQTEITSAVVFRCYDKQTGEVLGYGVPSDSSSETYYVTYNKTDHRYECNCPCGEKHHHTVECKHIRAVKQVVAARRELAQASTPVAKKYDVVSEALAVVNQAMADAKIGDTYEQITYAYGSCGHLVKPEHEGQPCGACLCK